MKKSKNSEQCLILDIAEKSNLIDYKRLFNMFIGQLKEDKNKNDEYNSKFISKLFEVVLYSNEHYMQKMIKILLIYTKTKTVPSSTAIALENAIGGYIHKIVNYKIAIIRWHSQDCILIM